MGNILEATILSGKLQGEVVLLPQIPMILSDSPTHSNVCNFQFACDNDFAASKASDHDVVGDESEKNSANPQTLVAENQHINPPEELELMANADYDALKKPASIKSKPSNPVTSTPKDEVIPCPACEEEYCDPPTEEWI
ncbi:hypothetical protein TNCV_5042271 [Trichonephila clavipes]|nr:hypothetical protein TNCV_5042271 [Trichonephila clavipes]